MLRRVLRSLPALLACLVLGAGFASVPVAAATSAAAGGSLTSWSRQATPAGYHLRLEGASCASDGKHCMAVGYRCTPDGCGLVDSGILTTTNGGSTWKSSPVPHRIKNVLSVACATAARCVVAGGKIYHLSGSYITGDLLVTNNAGASWTVLAAPHGLVAQDVVCPTATTCFASSGSLHGGPPAAVLATTDGGAHWKVEAVPASFTGLLGISCPSATRCVAVGGIGSGSRSAFLATANGGTTWQEEAAPAGINLAGISCPTSSDCFSTGFDPAIGGGAIVATTNGGKTWTKQFASASAGVAGLSCPTATQCAVAATGGTNGYTIVVTTDGGAKWVRVSVPAVRGGSLNTVSCVSAARCLAVGNLLSPAHGAVKYDSPLILTNSR